MGIFSVIRKLLASMFAAVLMIGIANPGITYTVKDENACLADFTVISDVHMEGNCKQSRDIFITEMYDVKNNTYGNDALVLLGDNTMNGQHIENMFFYGILSIISPADKVFMTLGNHDTGNGENKYNNLIKRFYTYYNDFYGENIDSPFYCREVNGYKFIFLGSEEDDVDSPVVTDEQLDWLDEMLKEATANDAPAFVFGHHPYTNYAVPSKLIRILTKYNNVFFFSGHTHQYQITAEDLTASVHHINLPRVTELDDNLKPVDSTGLGVNVEVYKDKVIIRERNFYTSTWKTEHVFEVK